MKTTLQLISFSALFLISKCMGANILAYIQVPSYSHQVTFRPLWLELAKRGHKITLLTTDLMGANENITQVDLSEAYKIMEEHNIYERILEGQHILQIIISSIDVYVQVIEYELSHPDVQMLLRNETKFDLVISECHLSVGFALATKLKAPSIAVVSMEGHFSVHDAVGNPSHPVTNPDHNLPFSLPLNFKERIVSALYSMAERAVNKFLIQPMEIKLIERYIGELTKLDEIWKNISMLFINTNLIFNDVRPLGPKTVSIGGGIHFSKPKPPPKDLQDFLDNAKHGVIYFSLGSNVKSNHISNKTKQVFLETFSQLPYQILWKFENETLEGLPKNVKIKKWIPQQDVLRHKNIKLFITQGGLQSMEEAIFNYVPMIGLPFFGDQFNNINKMVVKKFGLSLDHATLEVETFKDAILEVINNPSYKQKTKELADLVLDQPMTGLEKAVWWTEYVIRHGGTEHFRNPVVDLPLYQYYLLDVISFLIAVVLLFTYLLYKIIQLLWKISVYIYYRFIVKKDKKLKVS